MKEIVWGNFSQEELDRNYDQSSLVPNVSELMEQNAIDSAKIREELEVIADVSYGPTVLERLDIFPASQRGGPVAIYHHGGAWTRSDKDQCSYAAPSLVAAGVNVLVLDFALAPAVSLDEIVRQNRAAISWAWYNADEYGWDRDRIHSIGHSSGGHICGMMQITNWEDLYGLPADIIKSAAPCSGMYELEPVQLSHRNSYLDLTGQAAVRNSSIRHIPAYGPPMTMAWGTGELEEFQRQSREFAVAWEAAGHEVEIFILEDLNHFEVGREMFNPDQPVFQNILKNIGV
ncbi:MAG: alpha/beta hydrolase [Pseudomonadota bacterium]|nr:alpha/beta hydrolase [Pseudomonadota bacterium]